MHEARGTPSQISNLKFHISNALSKPARLSFFKVMSLSLRRFLRVVPIGHSTPAHPAAPRRHLLPGDHRCLRPSFSPKGCLSVSQTMTGGARIKPFHPPTHRLLCNRLPGLSREGKLELQVLPPSLLVTLSSRWIVALDAFCGWCRSAARPQWGPHTGRGTRTSGDRRQDPLPKRCPRPFISFPASPPHPRALRRAES